MDNERHSTWNAPPPIPLGESPPSKGMPHSGGARILPDLNFPPEDESITGEPSNPQHGPSNPQQVPSNPPNSPEQDPPDISFFRARVINRPPKPFFTGKIAGALESMRKLLMRIRRRGSKHKKEGGSPKRKNARRGQPKSEDRRKRNKRTPGDDMEM